MIDFPPMTDAVSKSIIKAKRQTPRAAYKSLILFGSSEHSLVAASIVQPSLLFGANTKNEVTPKTRPIAERPGPIMEISSTPSIFLNLVRAKMVIPITAADVRVTASKTTPSFLTEAASEIFETAILVQKVKIKVRA